MNTNKAQQAALYVAVTVIVALTIAAFWLSYSHLADVAGEYGLGESPARKWAWPGTLDLFIVAGEILMFRSALRQCVDWWAVMLTVTGSGGSIALNISGVGTGARVLDYVVAGIPPTAALLAFGALMRQVHTMVTADTPAATKEDTATEPVTADAPATPPADTPDEEVATPDTETTPPADTEEDTDADTSQAPDTEDEVAKARERKAATRGRSEEDIQAFVDYLNETGQPVNGTTYAAHVGNISTRTARRDLAKIGITG